MTKEAELVRDRLYVSSPPAVIAGAPCTDVMISDLIVQSRKSMSARNDGFLKALSRRNRAWRSGWLASSAFFSEASISGLHCSNRPCVPEREDAQTSHRNTPTKTSRYIPATTDTTLLSTVPFAILSWTDRFAVNIHLMECGWGAGTFVS
jgi:hypothetical protein